MNLVPAPDVGGSLSPRSVTAPQPLHETATSASVVVAFNERDERLNAIKTTRRDSDERVCWMTENRWKRSETVGSMHRRRKVRVRNEIVKKDTRSKSRKSRFLGGRGPTNGRGRDPAFVGKIFSSYGLRSSCRIQMLAKRNSWRGSRRTAFPAEDSWKEMVRISPMECIGKRELLPPGSSLGLHGNPT